MVYSVRGQLLFYSLARLRERVRERVRACHPGAALADAPLALSRRERARGERRLALIEAPVDSRLRGNDDAFFRCAAWIASLRSQ